jgi:RNA-directed DNA polymerase
MSTEALTAVSSQKQPLEVLFEAMFHGKRAFADFVSAEVETNCEKGTYLRGGRKREVVKPNDRLRGLHEFIRLFVLDFLPLNERVVFSYRKGFSAYDAVVPHAAADCFFVCDIADFFQNLRGARIRSTLLTAGDACPIEDFDLWLPRIVDLVCVDDRLPMGFATSPAISNAALRRFDDEFEAHCDHNELAYSRYSDDIIVSAKGYEALADISEVVKHTLMHSMGGELDIHPNKSRYFHRGAKIKLLGMVLLPNGSVTVDASVKREVEVLIHFFLTDKEKFVGRAGGDRQKGEARLSGLLNYVNTVDQSYLDKLRRKFGLAVVDFFLHRSFS